MKHIPIDPSHLTRAFTGDNKIASLAMPYLFESEGYTRVPAGGGGWLLSRGDELLKVRCLTADGVSFGPSVAKGAGRTATAANWEQGMERLTGFLVYDAVNYADGIRTWVVPVEVVEDMRRRGIAGIKGDVNRFEMLTRLGAF